MSITLDQSRMSSELTCSVITGIAKLVVIQPFDLIRFRVQSSDNSSIKIQKLIKNLYSKEGLQIFLKGFNVTGLAVFTSSLLQFSLYQKFLNYFSTKAKTKYLNNTNEIKRVSYFKILENESFRLNKSFINALSGFCSGIFLALFTLPIDNMRIKLQSVQNVQSASKNLYKNKGLIDVSKDIYKNFGFKGFYIALPISMARESIASCIYFGLFEYLKNRKLILNKTKDISVLNKFQYGAIAGGVNWLITLPIDTVKTKLISDTSNFKDERKYKGSLDCFKKVYNTKGIQGFYYGFSVVFLRGMLVNGIVLTAFDYTRNRYVK